MSALSGVQGSTNGLAPLAVPGDAATTPLADAAVSSPPISSPSKKIVFIRKTTQPTTTAEATQSTTDQPTSPTLASLIVNGTATSHAAAAVAVAVTSVAESSSASYRVQLGRRNYAAASDITTAVAASGTSASSPAIEASAPSSATAASTRARIERTESDSPNHAAEQRKTALRAELAAAQARIEQKQGEIKAVQDARTAAAAAASKPSTPAKSPTGPPPRNVTPPPSITTDVPSSVKALVTQASPPTTARKDVPLASPTSAEPVSKRYSLQRKATGGGMLVATQLNPTAAPAYSGTPATHVSTPSIPDHPAAMSVANLTPTQLSSLLNGSNPPIPAPAAVPAPVPPAPSTSAPSLDDLPDHPAMQSLSRATSRADPPKPPEQRTAPERRQSNLQLDIPATKAAAIQVLAQNGADQVQPFTPLSPNSPAPIGGGAAMTSPPHPSSSTPAHLASPLQAFGTPSRGSGAPLSSGETFVEPFSSGATGRTPSRTPNRSRDPSPKRTRTPGGLGEGERLPALPGSRRHSLNQSAEASAPMISPGGASSSRFGLDENTSKSRRGSLNHLPPIHASNLSSTGVIIAAQAQNMTPSHALGQQSSLDNTVRPGSMEFSSPPSQPSGTASSRIKLAIGLPSDGIGHRHQSSGEAAFADAVQMALLASSPGRRDFSPTGMDGRDPRQTPPTAGMGMASRRRVAPTTAQVKPVLDPQSQLAPSALAPPNRLRWMIALAPGTLLLIAALVLLFVNGGGYDELNKQSDTVILAGLILQGAGLLGFLIILALIAIFATPFRSVVGFLFLLSLTATMLGTAAFIQSREKDEMLAIFDSTIVGVFQLELLAVVLLFLVFTVWMYRAPQRATERVLVVLDGIDLSTLSRDIRTMKGINAELLTEAQGGPAAERSRPTTGLASPIMAGEVRASRPGTALNGGVVELPSYTMGNYDNPLPRPPSSSNISSMTGSMRAPKGEKRRNKKDRHTAGNFSQQFLSVGAIASVLAPHAAPAAGDRMQAGATAPSTDNYNFASGGSRRSSVDATAMKMLMAANLALAQKVQSLEAGATQSGRVADGADLRGPSFRDR